MSYDLILKHSNINWARGETVPAPQPTAPVAPTAAPATLSSTNQCTPAERALIVQIAAIKRAAQKGDRKAQKQWKALLDGISVLKMKASKGDPKAKRNLQCLKASGLFAAPVAVRGEFIGSYATQILGSDLNDDELAVAQEGGSSERQALARMRGISISKMEGRKRHGGKRSRHLKKIIKKAAQGDANALAQMRQVQQRLSRRAAAGDPRANSLVRKIQQWYSSYQSQYQGATQTQYPAYPSAAPYTQPYQTPYTPTQQPYSPYPGAPSSPADNEQELAITDPEL